MRLTPVSEGTAFGMLRPVARGKLGVRMPEEIVLRKFSLVPRKNATRSKRQATPGTSVMERKVWEPCVLQFLGER